MTDNAANHAAFPGQLLRSLVGLCSAMVAAEPWRKPVGWSKTPSSGVVDRW